MGGQGHDTIDLVVNGARLAEAEATDLRVLERPLKSLALADSPVLLRGAPEDCRHVVQRLHELGRRSQFPLRICTEQAQAEPLFDLSSIAALPTDAVAGTWALYGVGSWPAECQRRLIRALDILDEGRLAGRLGHRDIPRILVVMDPDLPGEALLENLSARLSYFKLRLNRS